MLKVKGGRRLQNFSHLWDRVFGYWRGILSFLFLGDIYCLLNRFLCHERLIRDFRLPFFLLRPEVVFIGIATGLLPLTQLIYLTIHEELLVGILS